MDSTEYNRVPYNTQALLSAHPDRLAALAVLFGMTPCPIRNSRILELGCGDGGNLIPIAYALPQSEMVGIDLAETAIAKGQDMINRLGLKNIKLLHKNIMEVDDNAGQFDYIIVHGIYSWVPQEVREKILSICKNNLKRQGVAFVSYNTYPGWHLRGMCRDIMRFHAGHFQEPEQKIMQAYAILKFTADAAPDSTRAYKQLLLQDVEHIEEIHPDRKNNYLIHDRLAEINQPVYFHEFIAHAEKYNLKYLAETNFSEMQDVFFAPDIRDMLRKLSGSDIIVKEQYLDFITNRTLRKTLLCHADVTLNRILHPKMMQNFYFSCPSRPVDENGVFLKDNLPALVDRKDLRFQDSSGSVIDTDHLTIRAALLHLSHIWPHPLHFRELLNTARELSPRPLEDDAIALCDTLLSAISGNMIEFHTHIPHFVREPGDYPTASLFVREQIKAGSKVTSLCHRTIDLENTYGMFLLPLLDGTRDRQTIQKEMLELITLNNIPLNGKFPSEKTPDELVAEIDAELMNCAKYALLVR
ncbi:MAG: methyltransferase domain-containing protein [Desulfobacteraceae bacterium]|nr:methyltransferase domain-containing protein [Desulfobacteraceae bacterium]